MEKSANHFASGKNTHVSHTPMHFSTRLPLRTDHTKDDALVGGHYCPLADVPPRDSPH